MSERANRGGTNTGSSIDDETAGLQRSAVIALAERLRPGVRLNFEQAVTELEKAVEIALGVAAGGERGTDVDAVVAAALARVAARMRDRDLDGAANEVDAALSELEARFRRSRTALLEEGEKVDSLRLDAASVARRIEMIAAVDQETDRPAWLPKFLARYQDFLSGGKAKGIDFSLSVAIEMARRMAAVAYRADERGLAMVLLGASLYVLGLREAGTERLEEAVRAFRTALRDYTREWEPSIWAETQSNLGSALTMLGAREAGTARLDEGISAYRKALEERTRERAPSIWAQTQSNLGIALQALGEREAGTARLEEAVAALRAALEERTRGRAPRDWAETQNNLGRALRALGEREAGTARLEEAVAAWDNCRSITGAVWSTEWSEGVRSRRDWTVAEIKRRSTP